MQEYNEENPTLKENIHSNMNLIQNKNESEKLDIIAQLIFKAITNKTNKQLQKRGA